MAIVNLIGGKNIIVRDQAEVTTILGSCVAVVLIDHEMKLAGLTHYLLPTAAQGSLQSPAESNRYGDLALKNLLHDLLKSGARKEHLEARVFGGANVLANVTMGADVGKGNIEIAQKFLREQKISVGASDVGGKFARRIWVKLPECTVKVDVSEKSQTAPQASPRSKRRASGE